ncbi:SDR family NAD(P)-dependent oxidoreductase [Streptomyces olindensis]|uniref:SDR family NAD(P)-dependent oxidoreductase n=1 Tax=Streptomyces olindensis TaxID=358823 RepID=UPI0036A2CE96
MSGNLAGRSVLVTGGGSGIGRAVALAYRTSGAAVLAVERSAERARELEEEGGPGLRVLVGDATEPAVLEEAVSRASGRGGLDNLTCCVGVFDYYAALHTLTAAELDAAWTETYRTNVLGTLHAIRAAVPQLRRRRGSITLTLSESAFFPVGGGVLYGSSKWALRGAVEHLAADLAPDVRVNAVAPGGTSGTRFGGLRSLRQTQTADRVQGRDDRIARGTLLGQAPRPEDHTAAYLYLADPEASGVVTGTVMRTDGGRRFA